MTNLEKMKELVGSSADKKQVINWAYMNRIDVGALPFEEEFASLENSVDHFIEKHNYFEIGDEHVAWDTFLDAEFIA